MMSAEVSQDQLAIVSDSSPKPCVDSPVGFAAGAHRGRAAGLFDVRQVQQRLPNCHPQQKHQRMYVQPKDFVKGFVVI